MKGYSWKQPQSEKIKFLIVNCMLSAEYDVTTRMSSKNSISPLKKGLIKPTDIENIVLGQFFHFPEKFTWMDNDCFQRWPFNSITSLFFYLNFVLERILNSNQLLNESFIGSQKVKFIRLSRNRSRNTTSPNPLHTGAS